MSYRKDNSDMLWGWWRNEPDIMFFQSMKK